MVNPGVLGIGAILLSTRTVQSGWIIGLSPRGVARYPIFFLAPRGGERIEASTD